MRILKNALLIIVLIITVIYVPTTVFATNSDDKIIEEAQKALESIALPDNSNVSTLGAFTQRVYTFTGEWRSQRIQLTRTDGCNSITITALNYGSNYIDICIFKRGSSTELVGYTKTILPNQQTLLSWGESELTSDTSYIDIFMSMYKTAENDLTLTISF